MSAEEQARLLAAVRKAARSAKTAADRRDDAIREAFEAGVPRPQIAKEAGISVPRVYQIIDGR